MQSSQTKKSKTLGGRWMLMLPSPRYLPLDPPILEVFIWDHLRYRVKRATSVTDQCPKTRSKIWNLHIKRRTRGPTSALCDHKIYLGPHKQGEGLVGVIPTLAELRLKHSLLLTLFWELGTSWGPWKPWVETLGSVPNLCRSKTEISLAKTIPWTRPQEFLRGTT